MGGESSTSTVTWNPLSPQYSSHYLSWQPLNQSSLLWHLRHKLVVLVPLPLSPYLAPLRRSMCPQRQVLYQASVPEWMDCQSRQWRRGVRETCVVWAPAWLWGRNTQKWAGTLSWCTQTWGTEGKRNKTEERRRAQQKEQSVLFQTLQYSMVERQTYKSHNFVLMTLNAGKIK